MEDEILAAFVPLIVTVIGLAVQKLRARDTNKHGDAFVDMLKSGTETIAVLAEPFPKLKFYIDEAREVVAEAEQIWESSGFTAEDMRFLKYKYDTVHRQLVRDLGKVRDVKE